MLHRILLLIGLTALIAGCGGGGGTPTNQPPEVTDLEVEPPQVAFVGGNVTITAQATDDNAVATVTAKVTGAGGTATVNLTLSGGQYGGTYAAEQNLETEDSVYTVTVTATDNQDLESTEVTAQFAVRGLSAPPGPPEGF